MKKSKTTPPMEETVMTMPVGALEAMALSADGTRHDGLNQSMHLDGSPTGKNEPFMCYKKSNTDDYVVVKIIHTQLAPNS